MVPPGKPLARGVLGKKKGPEKKIGRAPRGSGGREGGCSTPFGRKETLKERERAAGSQNSRELCVVAGGEGRTERRA